MAASADLASARTEKLRARAFELGFHAFGVASVPPVEAEAEARLRDWLAAGYHGQLGYMQTTADRRADIHANLAGARSVVALAVSYFRPEARTDGPLKVARYAQGGDYHKWVRKRVRRLRRTLLELAPGSRIYPTVDTSPVLERAWAARAGIAWLGKSTMAIHPKLGTYTFLATLLTDCELVPGDPLPDRCGSCTACLDACPTGAFPEPGLLDANRCIAHWTLEVPGEWPAEAPPLSGWVAGCDICQEVCPWNKFALVSEVTQTAPRDPLASPDPALWLDGLREAELGAKIAGTALARTGAPALQRNARRVESEGEG